MSYGAPLSLTDPAPSAAQTARKSPKTGSSAVEHSLSTALPSFVSSENASASPPPTGLITPVESGTLPAINPASIGLLTAQDGGLGSGMWANTSYDLVAQLLPALRLPTSSPALNDLARRLLLTTASAPDGAPVLESSPLTGWRIEKLIALGDSADAWALAKLADSGQAGHAALRRAAEYGLVNGLSDDICAKLPSFIKTQSHEMDWQKLLLICQLHSKDAKAAQLSLDLLRSQGVKDDILFPIAERNILGESNQLPRRLTPLKPLVLALLRMANLPLRNELYAHPDAALISEVLKAPAEDESSRLALAERAAAAGLITADELAGAYNARPFSTEELASAAQGKGTGASLRALLYQAAAQEKNPQTRIAEIVRFSQSMSPTDAGGVMPVLLARLLDGVQPAPDYNLSSTAIARLLILAGKVDTAHLWIRQAQEASAALPGVAADLQALWPFMAFAGLEADTTFAAHCMAWLDFMLAAPSSPEGSPNVESRHAALSLLLLLHANGFTVPESAWARVIEAPVFEKKISPPVFFLERLREAGAAGRKAETVLLGLLAASDEKSVPFASALETIRALRLAGLPQDAARLARETALSVLPSLPSTGL